MSSSCSGPSGNEPGTARADGRALDATGGAWQGRVVPAGVEGLSGLASKSQLRMSFLRRAAITVPLLLLLGLAAGRVAPAGSENGWYAALAKPGLNPPDWVFPVVWSTMYVLMGLALAIVLHARGAKGRGAAMALFALGFALNLAWTPIFFGLREIGSALGVIVAMLVVGMATTVAFARIRPLAGWLLVPYLVWIGFAGVLTWRILQLNPDAGNIAPGSRTTQIIE